MTKPFSPERNVRAMQQRLLRAFREDFADSPHRLIVGFSGGADSLALAVLLKQIKTAISCSIELVHVNHHLRSESNDDAEAAGALADSLNVPFRVREINGDVRQLHPGVGVEEAARRERYLLLCEDANQESVIVLGHHAQDQAETILMHMMRGAGLHGTAGMKRLSLLDVPWWGDPESSRTMQLWRPLLFENREQLREIPAIFNLFPVEDPTNRDESYRRNAVRHRLIPVLNEIDPGAIASFGRFSQIAAAEDQFLARLTSEAIVDLLDATDGLRVEALTDLDPALQRRVVQQWLMERIGESPSFERVTAVLLLAATRNRSAVVNVRGGIVAGVFGNSLRCGERSALEDLAWRDAGLLLPLSPRDANESLRDLCVVVCDNRSFGESIAVPLPKVAFEKVSFRRVGNERINGAELEDDAWMRRAGFSPWIRDRITGVALDDRMWWIPRMSDDYSDELPLIVCRIAEENY